jgi:hypothetical protein
MAERVYSASKTMREFHKDDTFVRLILGPIGSGKSVASCVEMMMRCMAQQPNAYGVRKSRWVIIRDTYRELIDTTMRTFFAWFPEEIGHLKKMDMTFVLKQKLADGTMLDAEFLFRALNQPDDVKKLLSLELTGAWVNEAKESEKAIVDMLQGRVGRYPTSFDGGPTWFGIIMDSNCPDTDHWIYKTFEENSYDNYKLFKQPSGLAPDAENIKNLPPKYYQNLINGKDQEWINVYVHGKYGFVMDGKPVWPEYKDDIHHSDIDFMPPKGTKIVVGVDFGLTPAAVIGFETTSGRLVIHNELVTEDMGAMSFGKLLHQKLATEYRGYEIEVYGDPAGEQRAQTDEVTPFQILSQQGVDAYPAYTNDFTIRRECVADCLMRLDFSGTPAFVILPKAKTLRKAMAGGYKYKRMQVAGESRFQDRPVKNKYSHVADACQYFTLGAIGGDRVVGGYNNGDIDYSKASRAYI